MERIRIGVAHTGAGIAPLFAAVDGGYFREHGLEPELVSCPGHPRALQALISGEVDFINSVGAELILADLQHRGDAVVIASAISRSAQQVSARPGLTTREDLRGKRWGVITRNDADECAILMAFERWGWDIARDAKIVAVGSEAPRLDALLDEKRVDVAIMHAPEPFQAEKRGWNLVEDLGRLDVAFQNSCAATTRRLIAARPQTVLNYVRAYSQAVYRFRTDPAFGIALLAKYTGETDPSRHRADLGAVRPADGRHDVSEPRGHALGALRVASARRRAAVAHARAVRRPRAGGDAGARRLLRPLHGGPRKIAERADRARRHHRCPSPHLAPERDAVAAGTAGAPHLRRLRRHPPRLLDCRLPGRRKTERRRQVGVRAGERGAGQGGGRGRLGAVGRRCQRLPARDHRLRRPRLALGRGHARPRACLPQHARHPPAVALAREAALPLRAAARCHARQGLAQGARRGAPARADVRAAGVREPDARCRQARARLRRCDLHPAARRHARGPQRGGLGALARGHETVGRVPERGGQALRPRHLRPRLLGRALAPRDRGDDRPLRSGPLHVRQQLPDREAVDRLREPRGRVPRIARALLPRRAARRAARYRRAPLQAAGAPEWSSI